ncbi:TPA: MerR family DNA-binding transcriptional regulator [Streptococcus suis]
MSLLPINQFAKKSGVTSETLRHYDRIGLLKPYSQNESGVRFYHVEQYEKLSTIKELFLDLECTPRYIIGTIKYLVIGWKEQSYDNQTNSRT